VLSQPLTGIATRESESSAIRNRSKRCCAAFSIAESVKEDKKDVVEFIGRRFSLDPATAEATHRIVLQTLSDDGTVSDAVLKDLLEQTKLETGVKKDIT